MIEEKIRELAIKNAEKYGKAQVKAVLGMFLSQNKEYREKVNEIKPIVEKIVEEVNKSFKGKRRGRELELPEVEDKVILRFAPNPSGPLHIGHARVAVLNDYFAKKYGGKFILRFEDTDPKRVLSEAYDMIREDLDWLNVKIDEEVIQSDRLKIYYKHGEELIKMGKAYVCECPPEEFRELRNKGIACPCRDREVEENLELWEKMLNGELENVVVRLKTDIKHKNPSIRDFPIFRVEKEKHPRVEAFVYPLMNLSVAVDDHLLEITHVLRGKDHLVNTEKQKYIYKYFNWEMPKFIHYGILKIEDTVLSTSKIYEGIKEGIYEGWDDVRLGTLRALRRRGIKPEAIYRIMLDIGIKQADITFSWKNLYAINKELIDKEAKRFFFVWNPVKMLVEGSEEREVKIRLHPEVDYGYRVLKFKGSAYVVRDEMEEGRFYRLMELFNVVVEEVGDIVKAKYHSDDFKEARKNKAKIIHWIPTEETKRVKVLMPDGEVKEGLAEINFNPEVGEIIQFERFGFCRVDDVGDVITCCYAHR
ncbi:glutamyl-tRNA synthetase [Methanocaldococcus infernus ME]|uniref:Glutamate--tRNA ligase n=1 Tax=Methanocaldococcus infernus (strain DSM 11812 / JCM 15783 / ME) TaxID=573063 RepID=D5VSD5_METIM|nr:glutamyl-tRNA synthetase [Methanocaldococcus infernus ME]